MNSETKEIGTSPKVLDSRVEDNILQNAWLVIKTIQTIFALVKVILDIIFNSEYSL